MLHLYVSAQADVGNLLIEHIGVFTSMLELSMVKSTDPAVFSSTSLTQLDVYKALFVFSPYNTFDLMVTELWPAFNHVGTPWITQILALCGHGALVSETFHSNLKRLFRNLLLVCLMCVDVRMKFF